MSASSQKKLRKEQKAAQNPKQRYQNQEDRKLKIYSWTFVGVLLLVAVVAVSILSFNFVNRSGYFQNKTIALELGSYRLNSTMFNYYYLDAINEEYQEWSDSYGSYVDVIMSMYGLDLSKPLDKQIQDKEKNITWAEYFLQEAINNARYDYAMLNLAEQEKYTLSQDELEEVTSNVSYMELIGMLYGYSSLQEYLEYSYGFGCNAENYTEYLTNQALAKSYSKHHQDSLKYEDSVIRDYEGKENRYNNYTCYDFTEVYLGYTVFLGEGTKDENGKVTYSDEEIDAAVNAAKAAADSLLTAKTPEEMKTILLALKNGEDAIYKDEDALSNVLTEHKRTFYKSVATRLQEWVSSTDRVAGDMTVIANTATSTDEEGNETTTTGGYYVLLFHGRDENKSVMGDVRHLLVKFEGGTKDDDGNTVYSDAEKKKAFDEAEKLFKEWKEGEATEDSFIELVKKNSDDSSASTGGLYENIHSDSRYVTNFKNWALDANRKIGDVEIIETEYGYHIMYYVGSGELNYRDYLISEDLRAEEMEAWTKEATESLAVVRGDMKYIDTGMSLK